MAGVVSEDVVSRSTFMGIALAFALGSEFETWWLPRAYEVASFERRVLMIRAYFIILVVLAAPHSAPWVTATLLGLTLVASTDLLEGRYVGLLVAAASTGYLAGTALRDWPAYTASALAPATVVGVDRLQALTLGLGALPIVGFILHRQQVRMGVVRDRLESVVATLSSTEADLRASQARLEQWNHDLNAEVERQTEVLEERNRYLSIVNAVSFALSEPIDAPGALERAARLIARLLGARAVQLYHRRTGGEVVHVAVPVEPDDIYAPQVPEALLDELMADGIPRSSNDDAAVGEPYLAVPLVAKGRRLGALALVGATSARWTDHERHLLLIIGRDLGVALENSGLLRDAVERADREEILAEFTRALSASPTELALTRALEVAGVGLQAAEIALVGLEGGTHTTRAHIRLAPLDDAWIEHSVGAVSDVFRDRETVLRCAPDGDMPLPGHLAAAGAHTLIVAPVGAHRADDDDDALPPALLLVVGSTPRRWTDEEARAVGRIAFALGRFTEGAALVALQQQRIRELAGLATVARTMQSATDTERLSGGFAHALAGLIPYRRLTIAHVADMDGMLEVRTFSEEGHPLPHSLPTPEDLQHPWFALRSAVGWQSDQKPPTFISAAARGGLVVPMRPKGQMLGVVAIELETPADAEQAQIVEQAVEQLALALDSAALYQQATARASHIQALSNLARIVASVVSLREAFAAFAEEVRWLIPFEHAVMLLIDDHEQFVEPYATYPERLAPDARQWLDSSIASVPVHGGGAVAMSRSDQRYGDLDWRAVGDDARELAAVPVRQGARAVAVFALVRNSAIGYTAAELDALEEVAGLLAVTMERLRLYERAEHSANHDLLTGLPNHRHLQARFTQVQAGVSAPGETALMVVDMDSLKAFNDTLGHEAGDRAIEIVARELRAACRGDDFVARTGGDEFVVLLEGAGRQVAEQVARRIHAALVGAHQEIPGAPTSINVSIGVAVAPEDARSVTELLQRADEAMYEAKEHGGGQTRRGSRQARRVADGAGAPETRLIDTTVRALLAGLEPDERRAAGLALRWVGVALVALQAPPDVTTAARLVVIDEVSSRLRSATSSRNMRLGWAFARAVRTEWEQQAELRPYLALAGAAVAGAWSCVVLAEPSMAIAARIVAGGGDEADRADLGWRTALATAIREHAPERSDAAA